MVKKLQRVSPQQSSEQLTSPVDLPKVREQVPNWLRMLLAKYGETEGRVVGLESESISQEGTVGPPPPTSEEESQVSSLLEQMATTGIDATPDTNVPTSVEWGAAPAESPPSIDDFLTGMETRQPDYTRQEYVQPAYEDTDYPETDESAFDEQTQADAIPPSGGKDVPDWLTEALEESPVVGSAEPSWAKTSVPSSAEDEAAPDWLTEALDMPPAELTPATPLEHAPQPPLAPVDHEVPDWLLETPSETGEPVSAESTSELSGWLDEVPETGSSQPGGEIPDWLTGEDLPGVAGPESPPVAAPEPDSFVSDIPDWQVPDWITEGVDALSAEDRSQETLAQGPVLPEPDIPDWIANGETPTTPAEPVVSPTFEPRQMPDWLAAVDEEAVPLEEAGPPPLPEAVNVPEWLVTGPEVSVTPAEVPPEQVPVVPQEKVEVPSWLQPLQAESSAASTIPPAGVPEWLDNIQVSTGASVAPPTQPPDWLQYIQADAVEAREKQKELSPPASKLKRLAPRPKSSPEPDVSSLPDWAAGLVPPAAPAGQVPSTLPDWAEALVPPEYPIDDAAKEVPEPAVEPAPQAELDMRFEVTELPEAAEASPLPTAATGEDWLADLRETIPTEPPSSPEPVEPAVETEVEIPAWLTGAEETAVEEVPKAGVEPAVEPELEIPDWLGETEPESPTPVELADELELEMPAWLTGAEETAAEKASEAGVEPAVEPELEIPDWLGEIGPEVPTSSDEFAIESDLEMPAWLLETEETPVEATPAAFEPEAETEAETPFWLGELPEVELAERMSAEFSAETEIEMPDWLSGVEEIPAEEIPPDAGTKSEMPAWLAELPEAQPEELPSPPVEPAPRAEVEMPAWSSGMEETTAEETPETFVEPPAVTEPELPSWLRELREVDLEATLPGAEAEASTPVPAEPMAGPELEKPAWLSEIEQEAPPKELPAAPAEPTSAVEAETAAVEPEIPSWLRELPEVETEEEVPEIVEPVDRAEAGMPDWLPGVEEVSADQLPAEPTVETDAELPPWLVELQGAETGKPEPAPVEPPAEAELEMPSWLSGVEQVPTEESPPAPVEPPADITAETPAWLSELSGAEPEFPTKLSPEPAAEPEGEMPAWLSGIGPAEPASTEETPFDRTEPAPEAETEIPAWLFGVEEAPDEQPSVESAPEEETELPPWLTELPDADSEQPPEADTEAEMPDWLSGIMETSSEKPPPEIPAEPETETDWLFEEEPPLPPWLAESPETETDKGRIKPANLDDVSSDSSETMGQRGEETPPDQGWLTGLREATEAVKTVLPPEDADKLEPSSPPPPPTTDKPDAPESKDADPGGIKASQASAPSPTATSPTAGPPSRGPVSGWLQALKPAPTAEMVVEAEDSQAAESTGVLAGLTGLLPVERMVTATPTIEPRINGHNGHAEAVLKAAQDFYTIATQPPQPATLPAPVARQSGPISSNVIRAGLFLLFIILVALPLLPGLQRGTPWTEPADELNDVLGDRRRQMIGEQLGVIDVQQPDSVALVSFDYSTATQGEMQPLAEAIIGRLKGQGMRVIFISLEPEGAALAQEVLDQKRAEAYGVNMVNLGYLPGQAAAIRALVTGQASLSTKRDFKEGYTFADPERTHWGDVDNLGQVDLIVTLADNPATARWWIEQLHMVPPPDGRERFLLAATSAVAAPFLQPYRDSNQLDGLISGINGAAAVEASRQQFGPARQMLDSQSIAHLLIIILIAAGTVAGWMPRLSSNQSQTQPEEID